LCWMRSFIGGVMKFFLTIYLLSALLLSLNNPFAGQKALARPDKSTIQRVLPSKSNLIDSFENPRHARVLWAFLTGEKDGLSPKLKKQFDLLELGFLFSPSGLHLSSFFLLLFIWTKKFAGKKTASRLKLLITIGCFCLPSLSIKRIVILRLLIFLKIKLKKKWRIEHLFFVTFSISFLLGHYFQSPGGFIMSFLFMGTFISLSSFSRWQVMFGLFVSHLLISFFSGSMVSLPALFLDLPLLFFFSALMSVSGIYLLTFQWIKFNWIEKPISLFLFLIKKSAALTIGTHVSASLFLILAMWIYFLKKDKKLLVICFLLHTNLANSPSFFVSGSWTRAPEQSVDK